MIYYKEIEPLLDEYETFTSKSQVCKEPELFGTRHKEIIENVRKKDPLALQMLAITLLKGDGVPKDIHNARELFWRLINDPQLEEKIISKYYYSKILCMEGNSIEGVEILKELEVQNFPPALALLGNFYQFGSLGFSKSKDTSRNLYKRAQGMGHLPSLYLLSKLYLREYGISKIIFSIFFFTKALFLSAFKCLSRSDDRFSDVY